MDPSTFSWLPILTAAGPTAGAFAIFVYGFKAGWWRSSQEVESYKEALTAMKDRCQRAEAQVDTLLPAVNRLTEALERKR